LQSRHSATGATPPAHFVKVILLKGSLELFAKAVLELCVILQISASQVTGIIGVSYQPLARKILLYFEIIITGTN
jgi:hypothetical protein